MNGPSFSLGAATGRPRPAALQPRQWQVQLLQLLRRRLRQPHPNGHDVLVNAGPGAGKTLGALLGFQRLQQDGQLRRFVVFCHRSSIAGQWLGSAERLGLTLRLWEPEAGPEILDGDGILLTYQSAGRNEERLRPLLGDPGFGAWMAIADEVHHLGLDPEEPQASAWGHAFSQFTAAASLRLGLTGTPFRADNLAFCAARRVRSQEGDAVVERIVPDLSVEPRELIVAGDVRPLEFRFQDGSVDHGRRDDDPDGETSPLSAEERESWRARNLRRAIQLGDSSSIALQLLIRARRKLEQVRQAHPEAGGLVVARDIAHARRISGLLEEEGDAVQLVHSQDPEAAARLEAFRRGEGRWLVSIDMCAEGFDAPRLRVVAYLTTVVTRTRFLQAITRAVRMDGERAAVEPVPRHCSFVFAPADPLLIRHARSWSLSEPYVIRTPIAPLPPEPAGAPPAPGLPLQALRDRAGEVIRLRGPQLPEFLRRSA